MTFYLRDKDNNTLLDLEIWVKTEEDYSCSFVELSSYVDIKHYSLMLIAADPQTQLEIIVDFSDLSELRGWLWEVYFMGRKNLSEEYDKVVKELKLILQKIADKYDLFIVQD